MAGFRTFTAVKTAKKQPFISALDQVTETMGDFIGEIRAADVGSGWFVIFWPNFFGPHLLDASQRLSAILGCVVSSIEEHDGDVWMHYLYEDGGEIDRFCNHTGYFEDSARDLQRADTKAIARTLGVDEISICHYFLPYDVEEAEYASAKAYAADRSMRWDAWVFCDFWAKVGIRYPDERDSAFYTKKLATETKGMEPQKANRMFAVHPLIDALKGREQKERYHEARLRWEAVMTRAPFLAMREDERQTLLGLAPDELCVESFLYSVQRQKSDLTFKDIRLLKAHMRQAFLGADDPEFKTDLATLILMFPEAEDRDLLCEVLRFGYEAENVNIPVQRLFALGKVMKYLCRADFSGLKLLASVRQEEGWTIREICFNHLPIGLTRNAVSSILRWEKQRLVCGITPDRNAIVRRNKYIISDDFMTANGASVSARFDFTLKEDEASSVDQPLIDLKLTIGEQVWFTLVDLDVVEFIKGLYDYHQECETMRQKGDRPDVSFTFNSLTLKTEISKRSGDPTVMIQAPISQRSRKRYDYFALQEMFETLFLYLHLQYKFLYTFDLFTKLDLRAVDLYIALGWKLPKQPTTARDTLFG